TLNLAARGLWDSAGFNQNNRMGVNLVLLHDSFADAPNHGFNVRVLSILDLLDNDEPFIALGIHRKRRPATSPQRRVTALDGEFDVLWIVVETANDDQIFEAARNIQFSAAEKSEVARPEKWPFTCVR